MAALILPKEYGYVAAVAVGAGLLNAWQQYGVVGPARKQAKVNYPTAYASTEIADKDPKAKVFNCAQRAHGNTLENIPFFYFSLLFSGLEWPRLSAAFGATYLLGRVLYTLGYVTGDPKNRMRGQVGYIGQIGLLATSSYLSFKLILASL